MYKIKGIFATIGAKNRNGRIYPRELWEENVKKFQDFIARNTIDTLMEWEHPEDRLVIDPQRAVAKITKLEIKGDKIYGEADILDVPLADAVKAMIDKGIKIGVSSRAEGDTDYMGNVTSFDLRAFDLVAYPSDYNAETRGLNESVKVVPAKDGKLFESNISDVLTVSEFVDIPPEEARRIAQTHLMRLTSVGKDLLNLEKFTEEKYIQEMTEYTDKLYEINRGSNLLFNEFIDFVNRYVE